MPSRRIHFIMLVSFCLATPARGQEAPIPVAAEPPAAANQLQQLWELGKDAQHDTRVFPVEPLPPEAEEGFKAFEEKRYDLATTKFRAAWKKNRTEVEVAKGLMYSQLNSIHSRPHVDTARSMEVEFADLVKQFPDDADLQVGHGMALAYAEKYMAAQQALDRGKALGANLEKSVGQKGLDQITKLARRQADDEAVQETMRDGGIVSAAVLGAFVTWIGVMFLTGWILAVCIPRTPDVSNAFQTLQSSREVWIERFYALVLSLSLVIFYLSVPFVVAGLIAVSLFLFAVMLALRVLHLGVLYRGFWAVWHMLRVVFFGTGGGSDGVEIKADQQPKLFHELKYVADQLDTNVVDRVYLVNGAQIAVSQEGAGPFGLLGRRRQVLHLGISILPWLSLNEFRSILAHEYAHFSHHDTFYARFIFQVSASLANSLAVLQAAAGGLNVINPFYGLYWLYLRGYALLSSGYSRSREFLADRRAVLAYGRQSFVSGLTKIYQEGQLFDLFAIRNTQQLLAQGNAFLNVFDAYRDYRAQPEAAELRGKLLERERLREPSWFDTHPTYQERLTAVEAFPETAESPDSGTALDLINNFKELEESLTALFTEQVLEIHGPAPTLPSGATQT